MKPGIDVSQIEFSASKNMPWLTTNINGTPGCWTPSAEAKVNES